MQNFGVGVIVVANIFNDTAVLLRGRRAATENIPACLQKNFALEFHVIRLYYLK